MGPILYQKQEDHLKFNYCDIQVHKAKTDSHFWLYLTLVIRKHL